MYICPWGDSQLMFSGPCRLFSSLSKKPLSPVIWDIFFFLPMKWTGQEQKLANCVLRFWGRQAGGGGAEGGREALDLRHMNKQTISKEFESGRLAPPSVYSHWVPSLQASPHSRPSYSRKNQDIPLVNPKTGQACLGADCTSQGPTLGCFLCPSTQEPCG